MSGMFDRCVCTPNARVFMAGGQVYCTRCLSARNLLPLPQQSQSLGVLGLFYAPKEPLPWTLPQGYPTSECSPAGCCWLAAIFPLARMTSGNSNFERRMEIVASTLYRDGVLKSRHLDSLQVYDRGCSWYPITGPVPGVAVYANSMHVSDAPFPGATHVLTNLPLPQRKCRPGFCPFEEAHAAVYEFGNSKVIYVTEGKMSWAPRGDSNMRFDPVPKELQAVAVRVVENFPPHHIVSTDQFSFVSHQVGISYRPDKTSGSLDPECVPDGYCWVEVFASLPLETQAHEIKLATQFGYQTKHGVPGKYIQRRLQVRGLRAVIADDGPLFVSAFSCKESWIRHLSLDDDTPGFVPLCRIRVEPNTAPLECESEKIFRFGQHKWYGSGKKARKAGGNPAEKPLTKSQMAKVTAHESSGKRAAELLNTYSPPAEGNCGWHCLAAVINRMKNDVFKTFLAERVRNSDDWATDGQLADAILIMGLPVGFDRGRVCPNAKYVMKLQGEHWTVSVRPGMTPKSLPLVCVQGCCSSVPHEAAPLTFSPDCDRALEDAMMLPSSCVPAGLSDWLNRASPVLEKWTVAQIYARYECCKSDKSYGSFLSYHQLLQNTMCGDPKKGRVTEEELNDAIDQLIDGSGDIKECLARLTKVRAPSLFASSVKLNDFFPDYVPAASHTAQAPPVVEQQNVCMALVPVKPTGSIVREAAPAERLGCKDRLKNVSVPLSVQSVMDFTYPNCHDVHYRITEVLRRAEWCLLARYGQVYQYAPTSFRDMIDECKSELLAIADRQCTLEMMANVLEDIDITAFTAKYKWTPENEPAPRLVETRQQRRRPQTLRSTASEPAKKKVEEVPECWESLADSEPCDLSAVSKGGQRAKFANVSTEENDVEIPVVEQPLCLKAGTTLGPASAAPPATLRPQHEVSAPTDASSDWTTTSASSALQDEPLDLSGSSQTEWMIVSQPTFVPKTRPNTPVADEVFDDVPLDLSSKPGSSASSVVSEPVVMRPKNSAQAIIDANGPLSSHLAAIKRNVRKVCQQACDPNSLNEPETKDWLDHMWERVDMLTWHNTSRYQASYQLASMDYLPKMILETPPPKPCEVVFAPADTPSQSLQSESDITLNDLGSMSGSICSVTPSQLHEKLAQMEQAPPGPSKDLAAPKASEDPPPPGKIKGRFEKIVNSACDQVFALCTHLPSFFAQVFRPGGGYTSGDWAFAAFTLCCLLIAYSYPAFGCTPLVGVFSGSARRVRMGVFGCWLAFAVVLFQVDSEPVGAACSSDTPECRDLLLAFEQRQLWNPVRSLILGPWGAVAAILGRILGGPRYFWHCLLRFGFLADVLFYCFYIVSQGRCKRCWGQCIRTAPSEVPFNVFPFTRATRQSLVTLCDRFSRPKGMDPIHLATGWHGCWTGQSPIEQPCDKPITYANLDEKKVSAQTVVAQPYDPNQAVKCLRVLQSGGAMVAEAVPKVVKVQTVPFLAPFFPKVRVDADTKIVVDPPTFSAALRSGYSTSALIIGEGDFAKINGVKVGCYVAPSGGAPYLSALVHVAISIALHLIAGVYLTSVSSCGTGTNDPWCTSPFSVPVYGPGQLCSSKLCISDKGLTLPLIFAASNLGWSEAGYIALVFASLLFVANRLALKADLILVLCAMACYVNPMLAWIVCLYPLALRHFTLHPLTILWVQFFLVVCNAPAAMLAFVLLVCLWVLGKYTQVAGLVTPYDIHAYTGTPRGAASVASAPDGTFLAAVRKSALTGRTMMFAPSTTGAILEGAFRSQKPSLNTVNVVGSSMGSGGVFEYKGKKICVTATHVLSGHSARVTGPGFNRMVEFKVTGDYAIAELPDWQGVAPKCDFAPAKWSGRAFWLTSSGVEPGVIGTNFAFCFTNCGDSGSPVLTDGGDLIGIHTGSNKVGGGIVTRPDGSTVTIQNVKLSELSKFFAGPAVPLGDIKVGPHVVVDSAYVPSDLAAMLASSPTAEGGLSTVQLICVFFLLWRMMGHAWTPLMAIGFFCLNEILPAVLVRSCFSLGLVMLSWFTPWSGQVLLIRLLTAALNRNRWSLLFYMVGGIAGFAADLATTKGHVMNVVLNYSTYLFAPRALVMLSPIPVAVAIAVHLLAVLLWLFKYRMLHNVLVGDGIFSSAFFLRYFAEGKLRHGVSASCGMNHESLTAALAVRLSEDDLEFLKKLTDIKCFVSASNMRNAANQFIEAAYAKALRIELAQLVQVDAVKGVLAKLEAFADTAVPSLSPGDVVVLLGNTPVGAMIDISVGATKHTVRVIETRVLAGSKMTVAQVAELKPSEKLAAVPVTVPVSNLENGPEFAGEDADYIPGKKKHRRCERVGRFQLDGEEYVKFWDRTTGDVFYAAARDDHGRDVVVRNGRVSYESSLPEPAPLSQCQPAGTVTIAGVSYRVYKAPDGRRVLAPESASCLEAARINIEQALTHMGVDQSLTAAEVEKLKKIINQLQGLTASQALNLLTASGLTRCGRGGLVTTSTAVKIVKYHNRTFSLGSVNLKVAKQVEAKQSELHGHPVVAQLQDSHVVLLRPTVPSLIDVLINGADTQPQIQAEHGAGDQGVDGTVWDFEACPDKPAVELADQIIKACDVRRGDAPHIGLPYRLHPVRGDPYRESGVLKNTRFGDITYLTPSDTGNPVHAVTCHTPDGTPVLDGKNVVCTTLPAGFELYVPTIPAKVLEYLDGRPDCPLMFTRHGSAAAATEDLAKYNLSTQGFVLPGVLRLVRRYLFAHVGKCPPIHTPSTFPAKNSMAGINGIRFPTRDIQSLPDIDALCAQAVREHWQTVTPVTLKKQYCSKKKTRTILGTNNFIGLALRSALSGVTQGFMKKGVASPIALGKNKFKELHTDVCGRCLEADLASCDRSTPAIVRWFAANLLFELACAPECLESYVLNCCHDLLSTQVGSVTKRGGLSSGDPITSISNTIYSLIIYAQHMVLSFFKTGHPYGLRFLDEQLKFEEILEVQPLLVYSDDLVLHQESTLVPNYHWWVEHLDLLLGFKTDPAKTCITNTPSFLGCRILNRRQLVPNRDRVLAALAYHMKASNVSEYYASAAAILMDSCACVEYDPEWFEELVVGIANCARADGFSFPGPPFFLSMWEKLRSNYEGKKSKLCGICSAPAQHASACGLDLCLYHTHFHPHCPVVIWCNHPAGSQQCNQCQSPVGAGSSDLDKVLLEVPYKPPKTVMMDVTQGLTPLDPGRYQTRRGLVAVRRGIKGNEVELPDGSYQCTQILPTCRDINMVNVASNILLSRFIIGPPGSGKTHWLLSQVRDGDVVYTPTHLTMLDMVKALGTCRFTVPSGTVLQFPAPSRTGPWVRILAAGHIPGKVSYLDEAAYCNHLDVLRLLSKTPLVCLGDTKQLHPVGFSAHCYAFDLMPQTQLTNIWRFGNNVCRAIQPEYRNKLVAMVPNTRIVRVPKPVAYGKVITPYHKDREGDAITIDSSQGATFDVVTIHLPTPNSLSRPRALVAITRARHAVFIYDPHRQLDEFYDLPDEMTPVNIALLRDGQLLVIDRNNKESSIASALGNGDKFKATEAATVAALRTVCADLEGSSSPLPKVAHNLGFYFSPDLPQFAKLPEELAPHWPVVTCRNETKWPDRLVASLRPINSHSRACVAAGYMVGPSIFLGVPGVTSYWLTMFIKGEAQVLPQTLFSTGRIEVDCREYLDDAERQAAERLPHAFIGETTGTTVGGCHHVTSRYLPRYLPRESVSIVGVSSPGKAAKALCSITDVYLPDLESYLQPETQSKCWKVNLDFKPVRLMVWKNKTAYFLEGKPFTWFELASFASYIKFPTKGIVCLDPCMGPAEVNRPVTGNTQWGAHLSITPYDYGGQNILTTASPYDMPPCYKLLACAEFYAYDPITAFCDSAEVGTAFLYCYKSGEDWADWNERAYGAQKRRPYKATANTLKFLFPPGPAVEPVLGVIDAATLGDSTL
ncbi:ORF1ab polyprotein [RtMc arterivirus]|uniref:Replicase polyprotein 1ab n=1 Tax=RtMc arterivirus TaxID=2847274 RepID=A0A2H4MWN4_9NIDO|nr:ORF1ab polyprotein [Rodent arterivirus]ATP66628.1 ORF1ab polyprotein [RtMc arterivirus]